MPVKEIHHAQMHIACRMGTQRKCETAITLHYADGTSDGITDREYTLMLQAIEYYKRKNGVNS